MVTIEAQHKTFKEKLFVFSFSATFNAFLITTVLTILDGGELRIVEGSFLTNVLLIWFIASLFSYIFLRSEERKARFQSFSITDDSLTIQRVQRTDTIVRDDIVFIHSDQHFYRIIKWHRFTVSARNDGKRHIITIMLNQKQKDTLFDWLKTSPYQPYLRNKHK